MNRLRLAMLAALAAPGLLSGCQSSRNECCESNGGGLFHRNGNGGLMSRLGLRQNGNGNGHGVVVGTPVSGLPISEGCCSGPVLGGPPLEGYSGGPVFPGEVPPITTAPPGVLPGPTPLGAGPPPLAPVPNGGLAPETPAPPSNGMMSRRRG
jgi:hypothetical protein